MFDFILSSFLPCLLLCAAVTLKSRDGILEQLGRIAVQDKLAYADCVYLANLAIAAVQNGYTTRDVEVVLRNFLFFFSLEACIAQSVL